MSEFTRGLLYLAKDQITAENALPTFLHPNLVKTLNDQWTGIFP